MKKRVHYVSFFASVFCTIVLLSSAFVVVVNWISRGVILKDTWLPNIYWSKIIFAERTKSPKIVLLGGSATLFSADSEVIEKMCGLPVVNLGLHAGLPFRFYSDYIRRYVSTNDIVVVALEPISHYNDNEDKLFSDLSLNMLWGIAPELQLTLNPRQLLDLYSGYGCKYLDGILSRCCNKRVRKEHAIQKWLSARKSHPKAAYDLHYLNEHGDLHMPMGLIKMLPFDPRCANGISSEFLMSYNRLRSLVVGKKARLLMTYPNLHSYPVCCDNLDELKMKLQEKGIYLIGHPETLYFPDYYYYDTLYHMSGRGASLYSRELAKTICRFLGKTYTWSNDEQMISFLEHPEKINATGDLEWYAHGIRVTNRCFFVHLSRPSCLNDTGWTCEFLVDRGLANGKIFEDVFLEGGSIGFKEITYQCKSLIKVDMPYETPCARLGFKVKPSVSVGLERVFIDDSKFSSIAGYTFLHNDQKIHREKGVSSCGPKGSWTDGDIAIIGFEVDSKHIKGKQYRMEFKVAPSVGNQIVRCSCGGKDIGTWKFKGTGVQTMNLVIPSELVKDDIIKIEFRIRKTLCQAELGTSPDKRHLGIRFISARVLDSHLSHKK